MCRLIAVLLFALLTTPLLLAQQPAAYRIDGQIRGLRDTTITLGHYFGYNQYIPKAKARLDSVGRFRFSGPKPLPGGLYVVMLPKGRIELMLNGRETHFSFDTDTLDLAGHVHVTGSAENTAYYTYQRQLRTYADDLRVIELQTRLRSDQSVNVDLQQRRAKIQAQQRTWQQQFLARTDTSLLTAKLIRAAADPERPRAARTDTTYLAHYYKNHFWDTFDFSDDRLVRTPIFQRKIDQYLLQMTPPVVDSLIRAADFIVRKARANTDVLSYAIWYITSQYERPRLIGTDGLFVHMAETYYLAGQMPNADSATLANVRKRVEILKPLLPGRPFPALAVSDTLRQPLRLDSSRADYTVVLFYGPTCGHCREAMPSLKRFASDSVAARGVQFWAIAVDNSPSAWQSFIREWGIATWLNGYDFSFRVDYRKQFDVLTTPTLYVLDKNRTILARALPPEQVAAFINFQRNNRSKPISSLTR